VLPQLDEGELRVTVQLPDRTSLEIKGEIVWSTPGGSGRITLPSICPPKPKTIWIRGLEKRALPLGGGASHHATANRVAWASPTDNIDILRRGRLGFRTKFQLPLPTSGELTTPVMTVPFLLNLLLGNKITIDCLVRGSKLWLTLRRKEQSSP